MKLLIITQAVDENNPVLGFFCRWVEELSTHIEEITIIALSVGEHHLPEKISLYSLGKEKGTGRIVRALRYFWLLIALRKKYTHVFVHMNPEFVLAGAPVWMLLGKKVAFWYNHTQKSLRLSLAVRFIDVLFYTSPYAASCAYPNSKRMPAGIDTELFKPQGVQKSSIGVYFQGRVAPAKCVDDICAAVKTIRSQGTLATLTVVGPEDKHYAERLKNEYGTMIAERDLLFLGPLKSSDTPILYSEARVSVNLTAAGNYDKTVLESMACETPVIVSSVAFTDMIPEEWMVPEHNTAQLAKTIKKMLALPEADYKVLGEDLRKKVIAGHDVGVLGTRLAQALQSI